MLPNFLQSSYQTYKQDTDLLAKWLALKAKQCGYPADLLSPPDPPASLPQPARPSQRLKGAARKKAKSAVKEETAPLKDTSSPAAAPKYIIQVKDFTPLAECIARFTKPAVKVPIALAKCLNRAIELRQEHSARSQSQAESEFSVDVEESNKSHAYFLGVLERTREILKPLMPPEMVNDFLSKPSAGMGGQEDPGSQTNGQISNIFDNLDIEEPSQVFLDAPDVERTTGTKSPPEPIYEAEKIQSMEEQYLATHCLFQDVRSIRTFLRQIWASYRDGGLSLIAVSITTNTAIDFIRNMEQDFSKQFPDKTDYESILNLFYKVQCLHLGHDPSAKQRADDHLNFAVYDLAEEVMMPTYIVIEALQKVISPNNLPLYKPGYCGTRDTTYSVEMSPAGIQNLDTVPTPSKQNDSQFNETLRVIGEWIGRDAVADKLKKAKHAATLPPPEPFRLLKQYPLLCGLFSFAIQTKAQEVGIDFVNAWGSIMYAGHLYNACRQERLLTKAWKDMEMLLALQSTETFFVGDSPKDFEEYLKRFLLSVGYSASLFASNRRRGATVVSARGPRSLSTLCAAGALFKGRYIKNERTVTWTPDSIKPILEAKIDDDSDNEDSTKKSTEVKTAASGSLIRKPKRNNKSIPTTDFLEDLVNALHAETLELSVDYLRMHRFCWMLLHEVNETCKPQLLEIYGPGYLEKENQLPFVVGYIFMAATQTSRVANLLLPRRAGVQASSRVLAAAAGAIHGMIDSGAGEIESKCIALRLGVEAIEFGDLDKMFA